MPRSTNPLLGAIGTNLRTLRRERGLSQEALADLADIDRSYMSGVERGLRNISVVNLSRLAKALDVSIVELIDPSSGRTSSRDEIAAYRAPVERVEERWQPGRYLSLS